MKKTTYSLMILLFAIQHATAQNTFPANGSVGIGTVTPNSSAITEMISTTKGLLIPRMTRVQRDAIAAPATGLMIYQTNNTPGFYYYSGTAWRPVSPPSTSWSLTGNAGTNSLINFIGTTDNQALMFKVNNQRSGTIEPSLLRANTAFGYEALLINNIDGNFNSVFGSQAMKSSFAGNSNVAFGFKALFANTNGDANTAIGESALSSNITGDDNTATGKDALGSNTTGISNVAMGTHALFSNVSGSNLVAIGDSALYNEIGVEGRNTAIGSKALFANTMGFFNTATGSRTLTSNTTGSYNTATGMESMFSNTTGEDNSASGSSALFSNTTGSRNTAMGSSAMSGSLTGDDNTTIGFLSFVANTSGSFNTASGSQALSGNSTGNYNTASGYLALQNNFAGSNNVATGASALQFNGVGKSNVAFGTAALGKNTGISNLVAIGDSAMYNQNGGNGFNTAVGNKALYTTTIGQENTATGYRTLFFNTTGNYNAAFGTNAMNTNNTGSSNTAVGTNAISKATTASNNTAVGTNALTNVTTGGNNTGIGRSALSVLTTGSFNTAVGYNATVSSATITNSTALGNGAVATASNQVMLGDASVSVVRTFGTIIVPSDGRFKKNIKENVPGLDFIRGLRPVTYNYDVHGLNNLIHPSTETDRLTEEAITTKEKKLYTGFIAQEVEKTAEKFNYDFSGVYKPQNDKDPYGLGYAEFVVPLVKAVQELSKTNDDKDALIQIQNTRIDNLEKRLAQIEAAINGQQTVAIAQPANSNQQTVNISAARMEQNIPNPFNGKTTIQYYLPQNTGTATIKVTAADGKVVKTVVLSAKGNGQLNLQTTGLAAGTYRYSLIVDGKLIDTKTMVLVK